MNRIFLYIGALVFCILFFFTVDIFLTFSQLNKQKEAEEKKLRKEAFEKQKEAQIIQAIINTALAVTSALTTAPPVGYVLAAISAALGAAQIAVISSQPTPAFASGGIIEGPGSGTSDSINARVSNGESIINARSTSAFLPILDAINQAGGGQALMPSSNQPANLQDNVAELTNVIKNNNNDKPITVSVVEINKVQKRVKVLENSGLIG